MAKTENEKPYCPVCDKNKYVINDGMYHGGMWGAVGIRINKVSGSGGSQFDYYCTKCFVDFTVKITYTKYSKDKRIKQAGNTGYTG